MSENVSEWISNFDLSPTAEGWAIAVTLSTVPIENWFYKRNRLKPEDLKLELTVPSWGNWVAQLDRHDRLFQVQWRPNNDLRVESQQIKYRKVLKWPNLYDLNSFPELVGEIEKVLGVAFVRHANVGTRFIDVTSSIGPGGKINQWLSPCANSIGEYMQQ